MLVTSDSTFLHWHPWQFPQAEMHLTLFFLYEQRLVLQSPEQLQLTNFNRLVGAIGFYGVRVARTPTTH